MDYIIRELRVGKKPHECERVIIPRAKFVCVEIEYCTEFEVYVNDQRYTSTNYTCVFSAPKEENTIYIQLANGYTSKDMKVIIRWSENDVTIDFPWSSWIYIDDSYVCTCRLNKGIVYTIEKYHLSPGQILSLEDNMIAYISALNKFDCKLLLHGEDGIINELTNRSPRPETVVQIQYIQDNFDQFNPHAYSGLKGVSSDVNVDICVRRIGLFLTRDNDIFKTLDIDLKEV